MEITQVALPAAPSEGWHWWQLDAARSQLNAAFNDIAEAARTTGDRADRIASARQSMHGVASSITDMLGHDGPDDARSAANQVLPPVTRAVADLELLGATASPEDLQALLTGWGDVLDHIEQALGAVGWD